MSHPHPSPASPYWHAVHPQPFDPECRECADPLDVTPRDDAARRRLSGRLAALLLLLCAVVALAAWWRW